MILPIVRDAKAADAAEIAAVGRRSFRVAYAESTSPDDLREHVERHFTAAAVRAAMADSICRYLLAEIGGKSVGFAKLRRGSSPGPVPREPATGIQQLYVEPSFQRRGVGEALMAAVRRRAVRAGTEGLWLSVWEDAFWAIAFYERCGFRTVGRAEFRVGRTLYDDLLMWMPIEDEAD